MQRSPVTTRSEYALGLLALFLLGLIGAAFALAAGVRGLVPAASHKARAVAIDRGEIR
ncbi:MAG TPA: hypothetical protein VKE96_11170 [Vicinamibacterales bacterium]|nr:hypothetical protein [Vicinamibacterales bacterium]